MPKESKTKLAIATALCAGCLICGLSDSWANRVGMIVLAAGRDGPSAGEGDLLRRRVCEFAFHGRDFHKGIEHQPSAGPAGMFLAVRHLARHAEAPICFEELPPSPNEAVVPIEVNAEDVTVRDVLDQMVLQDPRYEYRERLGLIEVLPRGADRDPSDCLNLVIPSFKERSEWSEVIWDLRVRVAAVSGYTKLTGGVIIGASGLPHPPPGLIEANFENQTVRDILTLLCAKVGNMAWTADFNGPSVACQNMTFHAYQPKMWYPSDTVPLIYSQERPKECAQCHYHEPCPTK